MSDLWRFALSLILTHMASKENEKSTISRVYSLLRKFHHSAVIQTLMEITPDIHTSNELDREILSHTWQVSHFRGKSKGSGYESQGRKKKTPW